MAKIQGLSKEAWEAAKYQAEDKRLRGLAVADHKNRDGNYETGEAVTIEYDSGSTIKSGPAPDANLVQELEKFATGLTSEELQAFEEDGRDLRVLLGGSCKENPDGTCDASDIRRSALRLSETAFEEKLGNYADPLVKASQLNPSNADIAFVAGMALYAKKDYELAGAYFERAAAGFDNYTDAKRFSILAAAANGDVDKVKTELAKLTDAQKGEIKKIVSDDARIAKDNKDVTTLLGVLRVLKEVFDEDLANYEKLIAALPDGDLDAAVAAAKSAREARIKKVDEKKAENVKYRIENEETGRITKEEKLKEETAKTLKGIPQLAWLEKAAKVPEYSKLAEARINSRNRGELTELVSQLPTATVKELPVTFIAEVEALRDQMKSKVQEEDAVKAAVEAFKKGNWDDFNTALGQIQDQAKKDEIWEHTKYQANEAAKQKNAAGVLKAMYFLHKGGIDINKEETSPLWILSLVQSPDSEALLNHYQDPAFQQVVLGAVDQFWLKHAFEALVKGDVRSMNDALKMVSDLKRAAEASNATPELQKLLKKAAEEKKTGVVLPVSLFLIKIRQGYDKLSAEEQEAVKTALKAVPVKEVEAALKDPGVAAETEFVAKVKEITGAGKRRAHSAPAASGDWGIGSGGGSTAPAGGGGSDW